MICINIWHERYYEQLMIQSNFGDSVIILTTPPTATADSNNLNGKPIVSFSMSRISITIDILSQKSLKAVCLIQYNHNRCQLSRSLVKICCRCMLFESDRVFQLPLCRSSCSRETMRKNSISFISISQNHSGR